MMGPALLNILLPRPPRKGLNPIGLLEDLKTWLCFYGMLNVLRNPFLVFIVNCLSISAMVYIYFECLIVFLNAFYCFVFILLEL